MNHTTRSARTPSLRTGFFASLRGGGSGAPSLRLAGLLAPLALALAALFALAAVPASAVAAPPIEFGYQGDGAGGFAEANGIAVNQQTGDVYLGDRNNNRVDQFGPAGEFIRAWGWGVADGASEEFQVCTNVCFAGSEGSGAGQFWGPEGIGVDNDLASPSHGDVYVVDSRNSRIEKFSASGEFLLAFGEAGSGPGQFERLNGRSAAVGPEGSVYVGDEGRVQRFSPSGTLESQFVVPGAGAIEELAVDSADDVYLVGSELSGVRKYDPSGTELGEPRDPTAETFYLTIAIGPGNELFVNEGEGTPSSPHHILTFSPSGEQTSSFDSGQESGVRGIAYGDGPEALYVINADSVRTVKPPPPGPFAFDESATEIEPTTAALNAVLNPEGGEETTYFFEYGESEAYGESTVPAELSGEPFEDQPVSAAISGLEPRTTYHFRVVVENKAGETTEGPDRTFTTLPPVSIDSTSASEVTATSVLLEAELNPHGLATTYHFEYDTSEYQDGEGPHGESTATAQAGSGSTDKAVAVQVQGLIPSTTYHFRLVAENELGTVQGPDRSFRTEGPSSLLLPDGRAWELVSPTDKNGVPLEGISENGGVIQAAADGNGLTYFGRGAIDVEPAGNRPIADSQLLAHRSAAGGWSTQDIATPQQAPTGLTQLSEYKLFSQDLSHAALEPDGATPLSTETTERTPYLRQSDGTFTPLVTAANVPAGTEFGGNENNPERFSGGVTFQTANPDLSAVLLSSPAVLTDPPFANPGHNLYEWSGGNLSVVNLIPPEGDTVCGGTAPACIPVPGNSDENNMQDRVSSDGSRVIFVAGNGELFLRDTADGETIELDSPQGGTAHSGGLAAYQAASADGSKVFFTSPRRLTADSNPSEIARDLYMCEIGESEGHLSCRLKDLTPDRHPGQHAEVQQQILGASADGSVVYFAAGGDLATGATASNCRVTCNLYVVETETGAVEWIALLSHADQNDWVEEILDLSKQTARVSPNGRWLAFMSSRSLTGYDNRDARNGARDQEVYLFDREDGVLRCASCNPTGARPLGMLESSEFPGPLVDRRRNWSGQTLAGSIPGWTADYEFHALYQSRYLSDSGRLFFNAADALVPQDTNGTEDVYEFEPSGVGGCTAEGATFSSNSGGCVNLLSSGTSPDESAFMDASETGNDVFFLTASRLVPQDVDTALDVYDTHACSSGSPCPLPPPAPEPECSGDACQQPVAPPEHPTPGSLLLNGPGNVRAHPHRHHAKKHRKHKHRRKAHGKRTNSNRGGRK